MAADPRLGPGWRRGSVRPGALHRSSSRPEGRQGPDLAAAAARAVPSVPGRGPGGTSLLPGGGVDGEGAQLLLPRSGGEIGRRRGQLLGSGRAGTIEPRISRTCVRTSGLFRQGAGWRRGGCTKKSASSAVWAGAAGALLPPDRRGGAGERQEAQQSGGRPEPAAGGNFFMGHLPAGIFEGPEHRLGIPLYPRTGKKTSSGRAEAWAGAIL